MPQSSLIRAVTSLCFNKIILATLLIIHCQEAKYKYRVNYWEAGASLIVQTVKNLLASGLILCQEDPLEKGMATHSLILARRNPWTEEPGWLQLMVSQKIQHD